LPDVIDCPHDRTLALANVARRLKRLNDLTQERLVNWGYAVTDAAIRRHLDSSLAKGSFPYGDASV
jgi:NTE family protein